MRQVGAHADLRGAAPRARGDVQRERETARPGAVPSGPQVGQVCVSDGRSDVNQDTRYATPERAQRTAMRSTAGQVRSPQEVRYG